MIVDILTVSACTELGTWNLTGFVILNRLELTPTAAQHLTHVHESCHTSEHDSWMIWQSKTETTHANGCWVCDTCAWVMARIATSNVKHVQTKVDWFDKTKTGPNTQYVTHVDVPCHTWQWVMSHIWIWKLTKAGSNTCQRLLSKRAWHYWRVHRYGNLFCHPGIHDVWCIYFQSYSVTIHIHMCAVTHVYVWRGQWIPTSSCTRVVNLVLHTCLRVQQVRMCSAICTERKCVSFRHFGMETSCVVRYVFGCIQQVILCIYSIILHSIAHIGREYVIIQISRTHRLDS